MPIRVRHQCLILVWFLTAVVNTVQAETPPKWKFNEGDRLRYEVTQNTNFEVQAGKAGDTSSLATQTLDVFWHVDKVDENGTMSGVQRVERIRVEIRQPSGKELVYDSASDESPQALAAMLTPMYETLLSTEVPISVTSSGEVVRCELPEEMAKRIAGMPATRAMRDLAAEAGVRGIAEQIALPLPSEAGTVVARQVNVVNRVLGTVEGELTWDTEADDGNVAQFKPALQLSIAAYVPDESDASFSRPKPLESPNIASQEVSGLAKFDTEKGRLATQQLDIKLTLTAQLLGNQVECQLHQHVEVVPKVSD